MILLCATTQYHRRQLAEILMFDCIGSVLHLLGTHVMCMKTLNVSY